MTLDERIVALEAWEREEQALIASRDVLAKAFEEADGRLNDFCRRFMIFVEDAKIQVVPQYSSLRRALDIAYAERARAARGGK